MVRLEEVLAEAARIVEPTEPERGRVSEVAARLLSACRGEFLGREGVVDVTIEGSVAKDTWVRGREEVDVFVHFTPSAGRERLESTVLSSGRRVIEGLGGRHWLRYASHPYIEGEVGGIRVNIVGCFKTEPGQWISAVDRTHYHTEFVRSRITPQLRRNIRLFKGFLVGCGLYGAEIRVEGFSGYLSELLVISHGGFVELLKSAAKWRIPVFVDLSGRVRREEALRLFPNAALIFPDPVDPSRNVAAAVSKTRLAELILASKLFLEDPRIDYFMPETAKPLEEKVVGRGPHELLGIIFRVEEQPPDILWGEIKHTLSGISRRLVKEGFQVYRAAAAQSGDEVVLLYELSSLSLPPLELRVGPPVWLDNAIEFAKKTLSREDRAAGPWVEGERLYALLKRKNVNADELLREWIGRGEVAISRELVDRLRGAEILTSRSGLLDRIKQNEGFKGFLQNFLDGVASPVRRLEKRC
ncbi:MAG: CCA tRNA nucleotidyltransferase [Nitrososphaerota archaeon]